MCICYIYRQINDIIKILINEVIYVIKSISIYFFAMCFEEREYV